MKRICRLISIALTVAATVLLLASCELDFSAFVGGGGGFGETDGGGERAPMTMRTDGDEIVKPKNNASETVHTHTYGEWVTEKPATCTVAGVKGHYTCTGCSYFFDENHKLMLKASIPATGHVVVIDSRVEPTTSSTGLTEGKHCSVCGEVIVEQKVIPKVTSEQESTTAKPESTTAKPESTTAKPESTTETSDTHVYGNWIAEKSATCDETGVKGHYTCSHCGKYFDSNHNEIANIVIPAKGHTVVVDKRVEPTTSSTGLTKGEHCSVCGKVITAQEVIPKVTTTPDDILDNNELEPDNTGSDDNDDDWWTKTY